MPSERDKAKRWWSFDIRDLLLLTALVAAAVGANQVIDKLWPAPRIVDGVWVLPIAGAALGILAKQFRGGLVGVFAGGFLGMVIQLVAAYLYLASS